MWFNEHDKIEETEKVVSIIQIITESMTMVIW